VRLYRLLLWLYPRRFRREYGDDMAALLAEQLRDEHPLRIAGRTALDLFTTVPVRHLEVVMPRSSIPAVIIGFVAVGATVAVVGGPLGIAAAVVLLATATLIWRRNRPVETTRDGRWWKLLAAGVLLLAGLVVVTTITGELPSGGWYVAMATLLTSFGLIGSGIVLGIATGVRSTRPAA
jgi:hypothetical protein